MFFTYILYSKLHDRYYVGSTAEITHRLHRHNEGHTRSTKPFRPWVIVYKESFETKTEARKRELQIKRYKGGRAFHQLLEQ